MLERDVSNSETTPYKLADHCKLISGAKRAAIYDLEKGSVYSLNEAGSQIIAGSPDKFDFWKKLAEIGLTESSSNNSSPEVEIKIPQVGLEFMWLELTGRCNQRCLHCYTEASDLTKKELQLTQWQRVIEEGNAMGCRKLQFIGGEPLLFKGIFDLAQVAKDLGYDFIEMFTNGTLLDEEKIKKIKDLGIHVGISLFSIVPEIHDKIAQVSGSFRRTFRALEMVKKAEIPMRVGIIIMKQNQETIEQTQRKLQEMGV